MKILVVENEPIVAQALKLLLDSVACEVAVACIGEAWPMITARTFDLIVLDAGPEGKSLGEKLRQRSLGLGESPPPPPPFCCSRTQP